MQNNPHVLNTTITVSFLVVYLRCCFSLQKSQLEITRIYCKVRHTILYSNAVRMHHRSRHNFTMHDRTHMHIIRTISHAFYVPIYSHTNLISRQNVKLICQMFKVIRVMFVMYFYMFSKHFIINTQQLQVSDSFGFS